MCLLARPDNDPESGFSLVEVMCALAIAAMALVALLRGVESSLSAANYLDAHLGARVIAQAILEDERIAADTSAGTRAGQSGLYNWRLVIEPAVLPATSKLPGDYRLYQLTVEVQWPPRGKFILKTLKLGR
jgi:type II secretion system protein I